MGYKQFLAHGCLQIGSRNASGDFLPAEQVHNTTFMVTVEQDVKDHMNTCGVAASRDNQVVLSTMVSGKFSVDSVSKKNLELALAGTALGTTTNSVSAKNFPLGLVVGDRVPCPGGLSNLASGTLTATTGTATAGTHYDVDLVTGIYTIKDLTGLTQPLKATATQAAGLAMVGIGQNGIQQRYLRFTGKNIADANNPFNCDIWLAQIKPVESSLKNDDYNKWDFEFAALEDPNAPIANVGPYGLINAVGIS